MNKLFEADRVSLVYLGDGLYARWEGDVLVLFADDGVQATSTVYLEPLTLNALLNFLEVKLA